MEIISMISVCIGYYNRKQQLIKTLESFQFNTPFEVCIVDDGSREEERIEDLVEDYIINKYFYIRYHRFEPQEKDWVNPCIAYNKAISMATGDILLVQNPECEHIGNVLKYTRENLKKYHYMAFSCLSWDQSPFSLEESKSINYSSPGQCAKGWYHHPIFNNRPYHFCLAIYKENMNKLHGFDERFKDGPCYDDVDLLNRAKKLGLQIISPVEPFVVHQWHDSSHIYQPDSHQQFLNNERIYNDIMNRKIPSWS